MDIQVRSARGIQMVPVESQFLLNRQVFVDSEITSDSAMLFTKQIMLLNEEDSRSAIQVYINSPGGEINAGLLMYDIIQESSAPIRMFCVGQAYSMAAILFACGNHGRFITPNGEMMIHEPRLGNPVGGTASSFKSVSDSMQKTKKQLDTILAKHTGRSVREVGRATSYDHYFSAEESIAFGLCDEIITDFNVIMGGENYG